MVRLYDIGMVIYSDASCSYATRELRPITLCGLVVHSRPLFKSEWDVFGWTNFLENHV